MSSGAQPTKVVSDFEASLEKADKSVASFETQSKVSALDRLRAFLHSYPTAIPILVLLLSLVLFAFTSNGKFFTANNLSLVFQQVTVIGIIAIAQTIVILTAGIDLSVGAIMVLSSIVMGKLAVQTDLAPYFGLVGPSMVPMPFAVAIGALAGGLMGYLNGTFITRLRLPPFIVTLGTLYIFSALKIWYSKSESIRAVDTEAISPYMITLGWNVFKLTEQGSQFLGIPLGALPKGSMWNGLGFTWGGVCFILLAIIMSYLLGRTAWGRHVYAVGDDPDSALLAGVRTDHILRSVYTLAGVICAFGALVLIGRVGGTVTPLAGETANLDSITAVVIGGTSLFGGRGTIVGSVLGAIIVGVFRNGLSLSRVDVLWQDFTVGILIIAAVAIDQWIRKASA
jgi:fructose transport system permease protein